MFAVKSIVNMTTGSIGFVTHQLFGTSTSNENETNLRHTTPDGDLFEPVVSSTSERTENHMPDVEQIISTTTNTTTHSTDTAESTPLLSTNHTRPTSSFTSTDYMSLERSSQIIIIFILHAMFYYTLAVFGFSYLVEQWSIIDSLYYGTVLFCTIGFGDIEPTNWYAQLYTICLAVYGIAFLGILLGSVIDYCLEYQHTQTEQTRRRVGTQVLHQLQDQHVEKMQQKNPTFNNNTLVIDETEPTQNSTTTSTDTSNPSLWNEIFQLILFEIPVLTVAISIAIGIGHYEGWTIFESIYWFVISGATVGFGDFYPRLTYVKLFCVVYLPFAVAVLGDLLGRIVTLYMDRKRRQSERQFLSRSLSLVDLDIMDVDRSGHVDKAEFLSYMLCALQKVSKDDIDEILRIFHRLDKNHDNYLSKSDLIATDWEKSFQTSIQHLMPPSSSTTSSSVSKAVRRSA